MRVLKLSDKRNISYARKNIQAERNSQPTVSRTPDQDELNHQELVTTSRLPGGGPGSAAKARTAATAFLTTRDGVVVFDAPPSIGGNLRRAVDEIAAAN